MREHLFRGKSVDNNEWVYGDLLRSRGKFYIHPASCPFEYLGELSRFIKIYEVDPETVGQYTGLTDKNGKKIFEGDIVRNRYNEIGTIRDMHHVYCPSILLYGGYYCGYKDDGYIDWAPFCRPEVIGNKWDNPELLEVEE